MASTFGCEEGSGGRMMDGPWGEAPCSAYLSPSTLLLQCPPHLILHLQPPHHGVQLVHLHLPLIHEGGHLKGLRSAMGQPEDGSGCGTHH